MKIHFIRHGDPDYINDSLTELGREEAIKLATYMRHLPISAVYASPLGRAKETASYTAAALGLGITVLPWIEEANILRIDPAVAGLKEPIVVWNLPRPQIAQFEQLGQDWVYSELLPHPEAEDYINHLYAGMDGLLMNYGVAKQGNCFFGTDALSQDEITIFSHHGSGLAAISYLLGVPAPLIWRSAWLQPSSVSTILLEEQEDKRINFRIIALGGTTHLFHEKYQPNTSGLIYNTR